MFPFFSGKKFIRLLSIANLYPNYNTLLVQCLLRHVLKFYKTFEKSSAIQFTISNNLHVAQKIYMGEMTFLSFTLRQNNNNKEIEQMPY